MRILYCNKYNFPFSGTESYLFEVMELMKARGNAAALFAMADARGEPTRFDRHFIPQVDFKNGQRSPLEKISLAARAMYSGESRRRIRRMIEDFRPDVAHVRNIYHHLSPSVLWELKARRIPVLYHVNDFKLLCPSYNLVSHGNACERCAGGQFWHVMNEGCYQGPTGSALLLAAEAYLHKWMRTYGKCVDRFLAPSRFVKQKLIENGWPAKKIKVLPHFQHLAKPQAINAQAPILYFGRLSAEKGVADLLRVMHRLPNIRLQIAGDGNQRAELEASVKDLGLQNVEFLGHLDSPTLSKAIAASQITVLPSHAYETFGKSILESYAHGRAVVATDLGSRREIVHHNQTGLLVPVGDIEALADAIAFLVAYPRQAEAMGAAGHELVRKEYSPDDHYAALTHIYEQLIAEKAFCPRARVKVPAAETVNGDLQMPSAEGAVPEMAVMQKLTVEDSQAGASAAITATLRVVFDSGSGKVAKDSEEPQVQSQRRFPPRKIKVAFLGGRGVVSKYSGIETCFEEAGAGLAAMGHEVVVYCRSYFTPPIESHNGMRLVRLPTLRSKHLETAIHTALSTVHAMLHGCDILHYQALGPAFFSFLPRLLGKKTVVTVQGLDGRRKKWGAFAALVLRCGERAAIRFPDATIVVSQTLHRYFLEKYSAETSYIPNATTIRRRREASLILRHGLEPGNYILFLGRLSPEKNCHLLIEAYERLHSTAKLALAGGSSHSDDYARELRTHTSEKIVFLDWVNGEELEELITNAMLFVLPSDLEGLSLALLDAMGANVCALVSDIPENRELIAGAGFTFKPGDVDDLERALRSLIANPFLRHAAAARGQARVRSRYLWPQVVAQVDSLYQELLAGRDKFVPLSPSQIPVRQAQQDRSAA